MADRQIAIFGGSFNPPHAAHELAALYVLETHTVDELWFVPTYVHPFGKPLAPFDDRVAMCQMLADALGDRALVTRDEEVLASQPGFVSSRTLDLIEMLEGAHPNERFRLVIGADILGETSKWYRWDELARRAPPIILGRAGYPTPEGVEVVMPEISATQIRALVAAGDPQVARLLPRRVLRYIADRKLYR